jgi:cytochrome c oxidase subunit 2
MTVLSQQNRPQANTIRINVTGQQWLWTFSYPGTGVSSNVLEVPNNTAIIFQVTSADVTHGFWPVELGTQIDANPGFITYIQATPDRLGRFDVRCSQLCGLYHSYMYTHGEVVTQSQFKSWLRSQGASASSVNGFTSINKTFAEGKN